MFIPLLLCLLRQSDFRLQETCYCEHPIVHLDATFGRTLVTEDCNHRKPRTTQYVSECLVFRQTLTTITASTTSHWRGVEAVLQATSAAGGTKDGSNTRRSYKWPERAKSVNEEAHVQ